MAIPFNALNLVGDELDFVAQACRQKLSGDGRFTALCSAWIERRTGTPKALLTHSCTAALEMAALLLDIAPGDEIIMPSFTFVSTANAFVLRGGVPVFVDIRPDTLNLDETLIEAAVTARTRAIAVVHYAGVSCDMDAIMAVASRHGLSVIEDAAQGVGSSYRGKALGSIGCLGAFSFHETKNVISGEGGALLVNDAALAGRAEVIREKGTDRSRFLRGHVDKYTWQDIGSSFLPSEIVAAFLWAQLQRTDEINQARLARWENYHRALAPLEDGGFLVRPAVPDFCSHNAHLYFIVFRTGADRERVRSALAARGIQAVPHYVPLHSSPAGQRFGRPHGRIEVTERIAERMLRLPLHASLSDGDQHAVVEGIRAAFLS